MKSFDKLIALLLSPSFHALNATDIAMINKLALEQQVTLIDMVTLFKQPVPFLGGISTATRDRIITFLDYVLTLEVLLLRVVKEINDVFSALNAQAKKEQDLKQGAKKIEFNADSFVDMIVVYLSSYRLDDFKKIAQVLDNVSNVATGFFASNVTNFYLACQYCIENTIDQSLFLNKKILAARSLMEVKETMCQLKTYLERDRDFHFNKIITELRAVYQKAPEFYFELTSKKSVSEIIKQVNLEFHNETSPYHGNPAIISHLEKCVIVQDSLNLLCHASADSEKMLTECMKKLDSEKNTLYKKINVNNDVLGGYFNFFSSSVLEDEKLLDAIFKLADNHLAKMKHDQANKMQ